MKLAIEPTSKLVALDGLDCRVWEGVDDQGVRVHCYIARVAIPIDSSDDVTDRFARRLRETRAPSAEVLAIPARLIL